MFINNKGKHMKSHCKYGHPLTADNIRTRIRQRSQRYTTADGLDHIAVYNIVQRECLTCYNRHRLEEKRRNQTKRRWKKIAQKAITDKEHH